MSDEREPAGCATAGCGCIFGFVLMIVAVMFAGVFIGWIS